MGNIYIPLLTYESRIPLEITLSMAFNGFLASCLVVIVLEILLGL